MNKNNFQYYTEKLWDKIKSSFMSKDEVILLEQDWSLVATVDANNTITLPSIDTFDEVYIEMFRSDGTVMHKEEFKKDSLLFESSNTIREILLDSISDASTYLTYDTETNTITPVCIEGVVITEENTDVHTSVYVMHIGASSATLSAETVSYNNTESELDVDNVQGAIDVINSDINTVIENLEITNNSLVEIDLRIDELETNKTSNTVELITSNLEPWVANKYIKDSTMSFSYPTAIAYGNGMYVAVDSSFRAIGSTDCLNWDMQLLSGSNISANAVAYGNNVFIVVGNIGYVGIIPTDGTEGRVFSSGFTGHTLKGVAYGNNRFVAVGDYGNAGYSLDNGTTWTKMTGLSTSITYNAVSYMDNKFVAVGKNGYYAVSTDGMSWTEMTTSDKTDLYDVAAGKNINGNVFVFVGAKGNVYYTYDGINIKSGFDYYGAEFTKDLYSVTYGNDRFVAVGTGGTCRFTTGARRWADVEGLTYALNYKNVLFADNKFISVGDGDQHNIYFAEYEKVTMTLDEFMQQTNAKDVMITANLSDKADIDHTHVVGDIADLTATATELNYMSGVTSNVQSQLDELADIVSEPVAGKDGKSAYQYAVDGGYEGTEEDFIALMSDMTGVMKGESSWEYWGEFINGDGMYRGLDLPNDYYELKIITSYGANSDSQTDIWELTKDYIESVFSKNLNVTLYHNKQSSNGVRIDYSTKKLNNLVSDYSMTTSVYYKKKCDNVLDINVNDEVMNWKLVGNVAGNNSITLPETWRELHVFSFYYSQSSGDINFSRVITRNEFDALRSRSNSALNFKEYIDAKNFAVWDFTNVTSMYLSSFKFLDSTSYVSGTTTRLYYR